MILGGSLLAVALSRRGPGGLAIALAGAGLMQRGVTGHCYAYQALQINTARSGQEEGAREYAAEVQRSMTINRPADELYRAWRQPATLRRVMEHFANVTATGETTAHWKMPIPMMAALEWDTRIVEERAGEMISWESLPGSSLQNDGRLQLRPATGNRGTVVTLRLRFNPPMGSFGRIAAKLAPMKSAARASVERPMASISGDQKVTTQRPPTGHVKPSRIPYFSASSRGHRSTPIGSSILVLSDQV